MNKGDIISYYEFEQSIKEADVYKFIVKDMGQYTGSVIFSIDLASSSFFNIPTADIPYYEFGCELVPYKSYQSSGWHVQNNNWRVSQTDTNGLPSKKNLSISMTSSGGYGGATNIKWFSLLCWIKPIDDSVKIKFMANVNFSDHKGSLVYFEDVTAGSSVSASDVAKRVRINPVQNANTSLEFKDVFGMFNDGVNKVCTVPSISNMYSIEYTGMGGNMNVRDNAGSSFNLTHNNIYNKGRAIEFLMFKGIK